MPVAVAAPVGGGPQQGEALLGHGTRKAAVGIAVLAPDALDTQILRQERRRADIDGTGVGAHARDALQELDARDALDVDGQRMGLVSGAGIGEVDAVEKYHGLVERAPADGDVGLRTLAPAFANVDRRSVAQRGLEGLTRRCGLRFPVEKRGLRHDGAHGSLTAPRDADLADAQFPKNRARVGMLCRCALRREQKDRHPHREHSDSYIAVQTRKSRPAFAIPPPPAGSGLRKRFFHCLKFD